MLRVWNWSQELGQFLWSLERAPEAQAKVYVPEDGLKSLQERDRGEYKITSKYFIANEPWKQ